MSKEKETEFWIRRSRFLSPHFLHYYLENPGPILLPFWTINFIIIIVEPTFMRQLLYADTMLSTLLRASALIFPKRLSPEEKTESQRVSHFGHVITQMSTCGIAQIFCKTRERPWRHNCTVYVFLTPQRQVTIIKRLSYLSCCSATNTVPAH